LERTLGGVASSYIPDHRSSTTVPTSTTRIRRNVGRRRGIIDHGD
jgi:hypothetical protein